MTIVKHFSKPETGRGGELVHQILHKNGKTWWKSFLALLLFLPLSIWVGGKFLNGIKIYDNLFDISERQQEYIANLQSRLKNLKSELAKEQRQQQKQQQQNQKEIADLHSEVSKLTHLNEKQLLQHQQQQQQQLQQQQQDEQKLQKLQQKQIQKEQELEVLQSEITNFKADNFAYVTLIQGTEFSLVGAVLVYSLKQQKVKYPIICLINEVSEENQLLLQKAGCDSLEKTQYRGPPVDELTSLSGYRFEYSTFTKLNIMNMTQYKKVIYLDADVLVMKNIDRMFYFPGPVSAVPGSFKNNNGFNAGILVVEPSRETFDEMMAIYDQGADAGTINLNSDQKFWNIFFRNHSKWTELSPMFNIKTSFLDHWYTIEQLPYVFRTCYSVHFTGAMKPWNSKAKNFQPKRKLFFLAWLKVYGSLLKKLSPQERARMETLSSFEKRRDHAFVKKMKELGLFPNMTAIPNYTAIVNITNTNVASGSIDNKR